MHVKTCRRLTAANALQGLVAHLHRPSACCQAILRAPRRWRRHTHRAVIVELRGGCTLTLWCRRTLRDGGNEVGRHLSKIARHAVAAREEGAGGRAREIEATAPEHALARQRRLDEGQRPLSHVLARAVMTRRLHRDAGRNHASGPCVAQEREHGAVGRATCGGVVARPARQAAHRLDNRVAIVVGALLEHGHQSILCNMKQPPRPCGRLPGVLVEGLGDQVAHRAWQVLGSRLALVERVQRSGEHAVVAL